MKLKLKDDPREWRKFALLCCAVLLILASLAYWRRWVPTGVAGALALAAAVVAIAAMLRPQWLGPFYRGAMRVSFRIGQVLGKVLLGGLYLFVVTPMGWALRIAGKDLLETRIDRGRSTYWKPAKGTGRLEDQF